jgi:hypothetical protein
MFQDNRFCNAIDKASHELLYYQPDTKPLIPDIGIKYTTNDDEFVLSPVFANTLRTTLDKWFGDTSFVINMRPIGHLCAGILQAHLLASWLKMDGLKGGGVPNQSIIGAEWTRDWSWERLRWCDAFNTTAHGAS